MPLKSGKDLATRLHGILQEKYQVHRFSVDLTVRAIFEIDPVGRVDFGGGEYSAAGRIPIVPMRERNEDRYEWWNLSRGCYFVEFNETLALAENEVALLEPHERLQRAGGTHTSALVRGSLAPIEVLLQVGVVKLQIKQNARIAHLRLLQMEEGVAAPKRKSKTPSASAGRRKRS